MNLQRKCFFIWVGLTTGNFLALAFTGEAAGHAVERSLFQAAALLLVAFL